MHFDRIAAFKRHITELPLSQGWGSYTLCRYSCIYEARMNPALNGSSAIRCFECSDAIEICDGTIEICNGTILDFYTGLYYICTCMCIVHVYLDAQSTLSCFTLKALVTCRNCYPMHMPKSCFSLTLSGESHYWCSTLQQGSAPFDV